MIDSFDPEALSQAWELPSNPRPIVTFGAGSIVSDAHFPAYRKAEFPIAGLFDPDREKAEKLAAEWGVTAYSSAEEAAAVEDAVFDLATPPNTHAAVLRISQHANPAAFCDLGKGLSKAGRCRHDTVVQCRPVCVAALVQRRDDITR